MTAIFDTMQYVRPDITTVCLGQAASAAAILLAGGTKGKRMALPNSRIMIHQPALGGASRARAPTWRSRPARSCGCAAEMEQLLAEQTGQPLEKVTRDIDRDKIMTAEEAKEYGIVDVVLHHPEEEPAQRLGLTPSRRMCPRASATSSSRAGRGHAMSVQAREAAEITTITDPPADRSGELWKILVLALAVVMVMALAGIIWTVVDGKDTTSPEVIVTIFSSALTGLIGLFVKSPR